jgi:predicted 3-demethylubiquinone-9 3-methyltransferase (glyoxalase superfamily)
MQKPTPCLWFDGKTEEAMAFYMSVFPDSKILSVMHYSDAGPGPKGAVMGANFQLLGQEFMALNGGPDFKFTPAVSFFVPCDTQAEIDRLWDRLLEGGTPIQCGWITDKFGLSWQITPAILTPLLRDADRDKAARVMKAMFGMVKLDIAALERAYAGS